jgi:Na+/melibiose symporter-like transporter
MQDEPQELPFGAETGSPKAAGGASAAVQKLSVVEKVGYSAADAAANFVFMTMILFQTDFYTSVFGLAAGTAAAILLTARLWDAIVDPIVGVLADRTKTRWGKFRPWILFTALPWCVVMVLAYTTPKGWTMTEMIAYAAVTNILLMSIYSMNNMPYAALGGVMTGDVNERAKLNSYRFVAVNAAQFIVGGFTLPLVAKFAAKHAGGGTVGIEDTQYGWQMTMTIWAAACLVLFLITFFTTRERIQPPPQQKSDIGRDFAALRANGPWRVMFVLTLIHFCILAFRGTAWFNYFHHYADKAAMYDWLQALHLTAPPLPKGTEAPSGLLEWLGYIVHADPANLADSKVADVFNSIFNMVGTATQILFIVLFAGLAGRFGKKAIAVVGFGLVTLASAAFYLLKPTDCSGMIVMQVVISACYAPTIPLLWAMFADVADYSEWKTGRRITGLVFATIGFALKAGLALGSSSFLWIMTCLFAYDKDQPDLAEAIRGYRVCSSLVVGGLFGICTLLLISYKLNKRMTLEMAGELAERRKHG